MAFLHLLELSRFSKNASFVFRIVHFCYVVYVGVGLFYFAHCVSPSTCTGQIGKLNGESKQDQKADQRTASQRVGRKSGSTQHDDTFTSGIVFFSSLAH